MEEVYSSELHNIKWSRNIERLSLLLSIGGGAYSFTSGFKEKSVTIVLDIFVKRNPNLWTKFEAM